MRSLVERNFQTIRDAAFLSCCPPAQACEWIREREVEFSPVFSTHKTPEGSHLCEYILLRRKDEFIDLGLAEHGRSKTILRRVYRRSNNSVRAVLCGNASLFTGDEISLPDDSRLLAFFSEAEGDGQSETYRKRPPEIWDIVKSGSDAELKALGQNPHIGSVFYRAVFEHFSKPRATISEDRYQRILLYMAGNSRLSTPRDKSPEAGYQDGYSDYEYNSVFSAAWDLAEQVPVTPDWGIVLGQLYNGLERGRKSRDELQKTIDRWRPAENPDADAFANVREQLARRLHPSLELLNSADVALRRAFYRTFDPEAHEFRDLEWSPWLERDPIDCLLYLDWNENIWRSALGRRKLLGLHSENTRNGADYVQKGWALEKERRMRELHPEWFADEYETDCAGSDPEGDPVIKRLGFIESHLFELTKAVAKKPNPWGGVISTLILLAIGYFIGSASRGY